MARYETDFIGMPGLFRNPSGLDPNYSGGYGGMRMAGGGGRAAYGSHRLFHQRDLETEGGFRGIHGGAGRGGRQRFDPTWEVRGGVRDHYRDGGVLREFNANSPQFAGPIRGRYDREMGDRQRFLPERQWSPPRTYRPGYSNRGMTDAGYSEGWAFGPMRGAR